MAPSLRPGEHLKDIRNRLGITTREVEDLTRKIAEESSNEEYYISNAWLTQLENRNCIPSIFKLFSLSVIYRMKFKDLLLLFGVDLDKAAQYQAALPLQNTHLVQFELPDPKKAITFPIRFDRSFCLEKSALVSRMVEVWGEVPISIIQMFDVRHCQYGYIGTNDYMMYPLIRPGSFVQIQSDFDRIQPGAWRTEFERPIYFIELRDGYACSWCELKGSQLTLIPHPISGCSTRQFEYPQEAEIVGQVTAVAMRIHSAPEERAAGSQRLPKQS
jgi:transcriptional regulator with XRE-family HTH domain